jgi:hypothetical protein
MAKRRKRTAKKRAAPKGTMDVCVPVPDGTKNIAVTDLKKLNPDQLAEHLKRAKKAKVGFTILNAPFKVRPVEPVS